MGFHPDFTGRQNVYMSGLMMGLSREEIERLMPEIEAFADIGDYIEEPVRIYSSGMQMRGVRRGHGLTPGYSDRR